MLTSLVTNQERLVNTTTYADQLQPAVTVLDDGTQVVVWASNGQDGSGYGVYAQRLDANGQPLGGEFRVNSVTSLNQQNPSVTPLGNGGFMVFWEHNYTGNNAIRAQRYDADGTPVGSEMTMAAQSNGNVRATRLSDGSVMAVWTHAESNLTAIHGQRFDADGNAQTGVFALATIGKYAVNGASLPSIAALEGGGYAISYAYSINGLNRHWDVYTQVYAANNAAVTGEILSSSISGDYNQRQSVLAGLADGGYVVVYMGDGDSDSSENGVFLRRYSATGQLLQGDTLVNSYVTGDQQQPSVTALADGGFVVAWTSAAQDGSGYGVYAQRYNANGGKVGGDFLLEQVAAGDQVQPALAARPDGGFVATWAGQDASGYGIRVREYAANGTVPPTYTTLTGTDGNDTLTAATSAPHRLYGLGGNDSLTGGASGDLLFGGDGDDTINGLDGNDQLLGGNGNDRLYGGDGNDTLDGGAGNNALYGGDGNDVYLVNGTGDAVREFAGEGIDEVQTTLAGYTLGANVERLVFVGSGAFSGTGNALDNLIVGGSGNDTLTGGDGADTLIGGNGDDRLYFDAADAPVQGGNGFDTAVVQGSLGASLNLAASSIEQAYGGTGNDTLNGAGALSGLYINGRDGNDVITGSGFNDTLIGGNGIDTLVGGDGDDLLYVGDAASAVNGGAGIDTLYVQANGNLTLDLAATGIERVFSGGGNDSVTAAAALVGVEINGGAGDDSLIGSAFNDTLRGDAGDDTLAGGDGNDTLVGGGGTDALFGGGGDDRLYVDSWTATVDGGSGDDIVYIRTTNGSLLDVSASIEHVHGGSGNDMIIAANAQSGVEMLGGAGNDWLAGGIYADSLRGDDGRDYLFGGAGDDTLQSGNGDDMLAGSVGDDYLVGGNGADLFLWSVGDGNDLIRDFNASQGDRISLAADTTYTVGSNARGDAVLTFASSETLTLYGVRSSDVAGGWFVTV
ncbi:beta strand repeat-containing protein [Azospirillum doebereinerae]|uniref:beta strand repeat-containing protein n=1 Tax=Azospirillum doebereinerae TaxID=92933 RepID=UPI001EE516AD|nr:hypothetical protein [Azospirillum doebereinerae]MCG5242222.1 hypothetical protein [Azospirillum doebereinerae]